MPISCPATPAVYYADQLGTPNPLHVTGFPVLGNFGIGAG